MKYNLFICFIVAALLMTSTNSNDLQQGRKFIEGIMKSIKGEEYHLPESCLEKDQHEELDKLREAIRKENSILAFALLGSLMSNMENTCPVEELKTLTNDALKVYMEGNIMTNAVNHSREVMHALHQLLDEREPEKLGRIIGTLADVLVYNRADEQFLTFLGDDLNEDIAHILKMTRAEVENFVDGFFEGVSSVAWEDNLCKNDISGIKDDIIKVFTKLIESVKTKTDIISSLRDTLNLFLKLKPLNENCRFAGLYVNLVALSTKIGLAKLVFNVTKNYKNTYENLKGLYRSIESNNFREAGVKSGTLVKINLNFSTK